MAQIITVINQKGGVGKSTTAHNLGAGLAYRGNKVLFIDLDAQCNLSITLGAADTGKNVLDVLTERVSINDAIYKGDQWDVLPACTDLTLADSLIKDTGKEFRLKEVLEPVVGEYDYIVIDTPPALGVLTVNALTVSNCAIVPALADVFSIHGVNQLSATIARVKKYCNSGLSIAGILLTKFSDRTILSRDMREVLQQVAANLGSRVFDSTIRESVVIREAQLVAKDVFTYAANSNVAKDYESFINEFLNKDKLDK